MNVLYTKAVVALQQVIVSLGQHLEGEVTDEQIKQVFEGLTQRQTVCNVFASGHVLGLIVGAIVGGALSSLCAICWMIFSWIVIGVLIYIF